MTVSQNSKKIAPFLPLHSPINHPSLSYFIALLRLTYRLLFFFQPFTAMR
jgi:hypothetical protein